VNHSFAQADFMDTTWFESHWKESSKVVADYYRVYKKTDKGYLVKDMYINNTPQMIGEASSISPELKLEGFTIYYSKNNQITSKGNFKNNKQFGKWVEFPEDQKDSLVWVIHDDGHKEYLHVLEKAKDGVYLNVDEMPEFPGGVNEMVTFIQKNTKYPKAARKEGWKGKVFVSLVIDEKGDVTMAKVSKSSGYEILDNEAIRVINKMPKWKCGKQNGEKVKVRITMPINFILNNK
jgi:TonB family protein